MLVLVLSGLALPFVYKVLSHSAPYLLPTCTAKVILGKPCPLCGMTRGLLALYTGHVQKATTLNPLVIPVAVLLALETTYRSTLWLGWKRWNLPSGLAGIDIGSHLVMFAAYVVYGLHFMLCQG